MLKVVGASWLQTRISTYILIVVALFGFGAIILGEFGEFQVENDGIYSATVSWNHKGGYRIDFWGQGNNLADVQLNVARAYYKTSILETGWSIIEIETSSNYPDTVQAYAAGLLEGSLTWQLIHHHWQNTVNSVCEKWANECRKLMQFLRENNAIADLLAATDPFWHMVHLFYIQMDGLEAGWRFAVHRSRQTVEMDSEQFLWLAMASDLPDLKQILEDTEDSQQDYSKGMIFLKSLARKGLDPLIAIGHATAAPYVKMLRLLKKYTFGYHMLPTSNMSVPGKTIVMSSYPGALSSHDEFYLIEGQNHELIIAGTPTANYSWNFVNGKSNQLLMPSAIMAANRLATNGQNWFQNISLQKGASKARQWIIFEPRGRIVQLVEQSETVRAINISEQFANAGAICVTGKIRLPEINVAVGDDDTDMTRDKLIESLQKNVTTAEHFRNLMRGYSHESTTENKDQMQILSYRGDLEKVALPFGVIDAKIVLADVSGVESFEAFSGPSTLGSRKPFRWSETFPNILHIGHPNTFNFDSVTPLWVWN
ncbi:Putative phospholipase B-like lamina ancestor [Ooceraea biroi]|uniref:Phospholipase B-like n=1 Tax=Ooceraea biroi TaxID=2015173 RepID=A0A026WLR1_OOCBI|nr:Putative phospholipase B-like lamina ancestor [Ooceraea biroi]